MVGRAVSRHSETALETSHARQCCQRKGLLIVHLLTVYLLSHDVATSNVVHVLLRYLLLTRCLLQAAVKRRYYKSNRHTIQRDPLLYNDELAAMIGCKPSLTDNPGLAWRWRSSIIVCFFLVIHVTSLTFRISLFCCKWLCCVCRLLLGSCGTAQYRIQGPGMWSQAVDEVKKVPVTGLMVWSSVIILVLMYYLLTFLFSLVTGLFV